ncbi:MAG TPA: phosphoglycerate dehydrogenase [Limnochordales bacterium]
MLITPRSLQPREGRHHPSVERLVQEGLEPVYPDRSGPLPADVLQRWVRDVVAAIVGLDSVDRRVVEAAPLLRVIARYGSGYDRVDVAACTQRGIPVTVTPDANTVAVAEYTLALLLSLARHVPEHHRMVLEGRWTPRRGVELAGRRLGVVGLGRIGQAVARRASALGMDISYYDVVRQGPDVESALGVRWMELDALLAWADVITLHAPHTPGAPPLIGRRELARMRPGALLVNTARGELVDEVALAEALESGHLGGAAVDVFAQEPPPASHPLLHAPRVILSPHAAAQTEEAQRRMADAAVEAVLDVLGGRRPRHVVNPEVYDAPRQ